MGVIRYFQNWQIIPHNPSYKHYLEQLAQLCSPHRIIDKHGKTIYYCPKRDLRFQGPLIAIGDAISSVNPLGWEGIRHAMAGGRIGADAISQYLDRKVSDFRGYSREMNGYFGMRWRFSEWMMRHLFQLKNDTLMDETVRSFTRMNLEQLMQVIFEYRFRHASKAFLSYLLRRAF